MLLRRYVQMLLIGVLVCAAATVAQDKPKIALYIGSDKLNAEEKNFLTRKFLAPFTASGIYSVIDRREVRCHETLIRHTTRREQWSA